MPPAPSCSSASHDGDSNTPTQPPAGTAPPAVASHDLQHAISRLLLSHNDIRSQVQDSLAEAPSLAPQTKALQLRRDLSGATCINQYVVIRNLGHGSYGKVKLGLNALDNQLYAIKMINRTLLNKQLNPSRTSLRKRSSADAALPHAPHCDDGREQLLQEIAILRKMDHQHVVKLHEVIDSPASQHLMLVMEYMECGPVMQTPSMAHGAPPRPPMSLTAAARFFRMACLGLDYMHYHRIVHGDLKPENLLLSAQGDLKIADFGCSRIVSDSYQQQRLTGTPAFHAPEVVAGVCGDPFAADVWALGVCLYLFVFGRLPFMGRSLAEVHERVLGCEVEFGGGGRGPLPQELVALLRGMLEKDPRARLTMQQVIAHPWTSMGTPTPLRGLHAFGEPPCPLEASLSESVSAISYSATAGLIRARVKEVVFEDGELIYRQGQPAETMWFITKGVVELQSLPDDASTTSLGGSLSIDLDESFSLDIDNASAGALYSMLGAAVDAGRVHLSEEEARELRARSKREVASGLGAVTVGLRGPGQVVGVVSMQDSPHHYRCSARARGHVLALRLSERDFLRALVRGMGLGSGEDSGGAHCRSGLPEV